MVAVHREGWKSGLVATVEGHWYQLAKMSHCAVKHRNHLVGRRGGLMAMVNPGTVALLILQVLQNGRSDSKD